MGKPTVHPVILAGGKGERFWPYSNSKHPKQLLPLVSRQSMLEDTLDNIRGFDRKAAIRLIVSKNLEKPVKAKLRRAKGVLTVAEPVGRNTAAAVALAARLILREDPQGVMLVLTADHAISPPRKFSQAMQAAVSVASQGGCLVTFGIKPDRPETGYGYIEVDGTPETSVGGLKILKAARFHEKPSAQAAREYLESGRFFWNSGMFAFRVDTLWEHFRRNLPATAQAFESAGDLDPRKTSFAGKLKKIYRTLEDISLDYGIMEKAREIRVVVPEFEWDDIGAWSSLDRRHPANAEGNRTLGESLMLESTGNTCFSDEGPIFTFGVKDLLIVRHGGVTMVVDKTKAPRLKELVKKVQSNPKWAKYL